jgi:hypothetical protein
MRSGKPAASDLILDLGPSIDVRPRPLIDAPRLDDDPAPTGFNWRPTLLIVAFGLLTMLAVAYL